MGPAYTDVGRSIDLTSGTLDSQAMRLAVPAASIGACPDSQQRSAEAVPPATQHCLPLGTELANDPEDASVEQPPEAAGDGLFGGPQDLRQSAERCSGVDMEGLDDC